MALARRTELYFELTLAQMVREVFVGAFLREVESSREIERFCWHYLPRIDLFGSRMASGKISMCNVLKVRYQSQCNLAIKSQGHERVQIWRSQL